MNVLQKSWQMICFSYAAATIIAAPFFMQSTDMALPFYSAQIFIVFFTAFMSLVFLGLDRLMDEIEGPRTLRLVGERVHQN